MSGRAGDVSPALREQLDRSKDLANQFADSANRLLHVRDASREATFRQFTFIQYGAVTFALTFKAPMWQTMLGAAYFGLLGAGTMGAIQYSIELLQEYLRYLDAFQRGEREEMPLSWLDWRDSSANAGRFVGITPTLRSAPLLLCGIGALAWCLVLQPIQVEGVVWAAGWFVLAAIAAFLCVESWGALRRHRLDWEWNRDHRERRPVPMQPKERTQDGYGTTPRNPGPTQTQREHGTTDN